MVKQDDAGDARLLIEHFDPETLFLLSIAGNKKLI